MSVLPITERIELERRNRNPADVVELNLDNSKATEIAGLSDKFVCLEQLSLVNVGLTSLNGLPSLPALRKIDLSDNRITGGLEVLSDCPKLEQINLSGNKLKTVDVLGGLSKLLCLRTLDVSNCELSAVEDYRKEIFAILSNVKYVDGLDVNNEEEPVGLTNGDATHSEEYTNGKNGTSVPVEDHDSDSEDCEDDDEDDEEEEVGIEALQDSKDLDDDEEDYAPGDEDDLDDDADDDEDEDEVAEDETANLSAAGVTGSRRAVKRGIDEAAEVGDGAPAQKCPAMPTTDGDAESNDAIAVEDA